MARNSKELLEGIEKLKKENSSLQQRLRKAEESIDAIKTGKTDALVVTTEKDIKVYTEKSADIAYRILIEKMHEGAVTINKNGTILYCNSYFSDMVNLPLQKVIGTTFRNFIDPASKPCVEASLNRRVKDAIKEEIYIATADGKVLPALMSVNALPLGPGVVFSIILTDLTIHHKNQEELELKARQLEQKNKELESANRDLTSFTYVSSHDLQEPLRKIQNFITCILLEEEKNLSESGKGYFQRVRQAAKRMQALIEDLLAYSRARSNGHAFEKTDLNLMVAEVKKDFEKTCREKKATIEAVHLDKVNVVPFQFRQVIYNLISNSLKFSKHSRKPRIIIKSKIVLGNKVTNSNAALSAGPGGTLPANYCHIIYTDNGIGFDPQYSERIFEVFQCLHGQDEYTGTGMGLAICKRIVENHNGIIIASGKPDKGARFDIYVPALYRRMPKDKRTLRQVRKGCGTD